MMNYWGTTLCVLLAALAPASVSGSVVVSTDPGLLHTVTGFDGFATTGDRMGGMSVTAFFDDLTQQAVPWAVVDPVIALSGEAVGTGWSLSESKSTFDKPWTLVNDTGKSMVRLLINGAPGATLFDIEVGGGDGTPGSMAGKAFQATTGLDITATYRNVVALGSAAPIGDLFTVLDVTFGATGLTSGSTLTFKADTDSIIHYQLTAVPEPSGFAIASVLGALALTAGWRRRKAA